MQAELRMLGNMTVTLPWPNKGGNRKESGCNPHEYIYYKNIAIILTDSSTNAFVPLFLRSKVACFIVIATIYDEIILLKVVGVGNITDCLNISQPDRTCSASKNKQQWLQHFSDETQQTCLLAYLGAV